MSTIVTFGSKNIIEPGVYSQIKANVSSSPAPFSTGNVLIIDSGEGAGFGGGSGISGELANNLDSVYGFNTLQDARGFLRGGFLYDLVEYLFIPISGAQGAPRVYIVRAATTTAATITYKFDGSDKKPTVTPGQPAATVTNPAQSNATATSAASSIAASPAPPQQSAALPTAKPSGGVFKIKCKNEGTGGNGETASATDDKVRKGYGALMKTGVINKNKWYFEFYEGTFKGYDTDGSSYDGTDILQCNPILIAKTPELNSVAELIAWTKTDYSFNNRFVLDDASNAVGDGTIGQGDYESNSTLNLAVDGTENYLVSDYDKVLSTIGEVDYTFVLSLKNDKKAQSIENTKLLYHITKQTEFKKFMFIGGGNNELGFEQPGGSIETAQFFDSPNAIVCHSGFKVASPFNASKKTKSSIYHAALVCGRLAGLQPQTSGTFKTLRAKEWNHQLTQTQREIALQFGVLHNRYVPNLGYVINQAVNTLQKNTQMVNPDGTSSEISIMRIAEQLNKELVLNMRPIFVGQNLNTASPADIKAWIEGYLIFKTATRTQDNLILRFSNVSVSQTQDYYEISYSFAPNSPLNKIFITGFILDTNLTS